MRAAAKLMGRYHFLHGPVVRGRERGRKDWIPNREYRRRNGMRSADGVYATRVILDDGGTDRSPTSGCARLFRERATIEAHIFNFTRESMDAPSSSS